MIRFTLGLRMLNFWGDAMVYHKGWYQQMMQVVL